MARLAKQARRFVALGALDFGLDYVLLMLLTFHVGLRPVQAAAVSFLVVNVFTYYMSMRFIFRHREDITRLQEIAMYVVLLGVGLCFNLLVMWVAPKLLGTTRLGISISKVLASMTVSTWNFFSRRHWLDAG